MQQLISLQKEIASLDVPNTDATMSEEEIRSIAALIKDDLPLEDRRNIVQSLIHHIEIDEDDIIIHWKF